MFLCLCASATALCWQGNAWKYLFSFQVSIKDEIFFVIYSMILCNKLYRFSILRYTLFWVLLTITKLAFSFYIEVPMFAIFYLCSPCLILKYMWLLILLSLFISCSMFVLWLSLLSMCHFHQNLTLLLLVGSALLWFVLQIIWNSYVHLEK